MKTIIKWGIKFNPVSKKKFIEEIEEKIKAGTIGIQITGVNIETISIIATNNHLLKVINDSDFVNIDGIGVAIALRMFGISVPERVPCPDIFEELLKNANEQRQSVYFLGADQNTLLNLIKNIKKQYPNIQIVGFHNGYYNIEHEEDNIVKEISSLSPTYLFLGLPTPRKELFIAKYKKRLNTNVCFGVGGAFDIIGEKTKRAPLIYRKIGLEWLYRINKNVQNNRIRFFKSIPIFIKWIITHK